MHRNPTPNWLRAVVLLTPWLAAAPTQVRADAGVADGGAGDAGPSADASVMPEPDAGVLLPREDGGVIGGVPDGGAADMDASAPEPAACSCETALDEGGRVHLCTGSSERDVCDTFDCERGTRRNRACTQDVAVTLCCDMPASGLYTFLYEDCTHPNCEQGFRAQCKDYGGSVVQGPCESGIVDDGSSDGLGNSDDGAGLGPEADDSGASCSARPFAPGAGSLAGILVIGLGVVLKRQRRQRG